MRGCLSFQSEVFISELNSNSNNYIAYITLCKLLKDNSTILSAVRNFYNSSIEPPPPAYSHIMQSFFGGMAEGGNHYNNFVLNVRGVKIVQNLIT